jgi:hypothetical protein
MVTCDGVDHVRVQVTGELDETSGRDLTATCSRVLQQGPSRLDVDLRNVTAYTPEGAAALSECLRLGRHLVDGVNVQVCTDSGRRALLESMTLV